MSELLTEESAMDRASRSGGSVEDVDTEDSSVGALKESVAIVDRLTKNPERHLRPIVP